MPFKRSVAVKVAFLFAFNVWGWALAPNPLDQGELIGTIIAIRKFEGTDKPQEDEKLVKDAGFDSYEVEINAGRAEVSITKGDVSEMVDVEKDEGGNLKKVNYYFRHREKLLSQANAYYNSNKEKIRKYVKRKYDADPEIIRKRSIRGQKKDHLKLVKQIMERIEFDLPYLVDGIGGPQKKIKDPQREINKDPLFEDKSETPYKEIESNELYAAIRAEIETLEPRQQEIANRILEGVTDMKMILSLNVTQRMIDFVRFRLQKAAEKWRYE